MKTQMLESILTPRQLAEFRALVATATDQGAQAVRYFDPEAGFIVVGLVSAARLETWFLSPAQSHIEAIAAQSVILHGLNTATEKLEQTLSGADRLAAEAIRKAAH